MGLLRPAISGAQGMNRRAEAVTANRLLTPANAMTAARIPLAAIAAGKLIRGERGALPWAVAAGLSDAEGNVARFIDRRWPDAELGASLRGVRGDPIADTGAVLVLAGAMLLAPRVPLLAKGAVAGVLAQEGLKARWAINAASQFKRITVSDDFPKGENLVIPVEMDGKESMAEKLTAMMLAAATNDVESQHLRTGLSVAAAGFAISGALRGERVRHVYVEQLETNPLVFSALYEVPDAA